MEANTPAPSEKENTKAQELLSNLGKIAYTLDKAYLSRIDSDYEVQPFDERYNKDDDGCDKVTYQANIRALEVTRWVYDKEEKIDDCFKNVMSVFAGSESSIALVLHRTPESARTF